MKIAIASGKGGTGKSTVSTNLAYLLSKESEGVCLLDCDVEEPNCHIFLKPLENKIDKVYLSIPDINNEKCTGCGKCTLICQFNALALVKGKVMIFPELCHSCGGCWLVCPEKAVLTANREVGELISGKSGNLRLIYGKTRIGEPMSPPLIHRVKEQGKGFAHQIIDCPPGISCPMIAGIEDADFVILVTEPTPFGLYDLKLAVDVVKKLGYKFGIVINKSGENDVLVEDYAEAENISILAKIPDERRIAECYSKGSLIIEHFPEFQQAFVPLLELVRGQKQ